ncbi:MAG: PD-(D/E)XK nuclease family protein [Candidatus Marsarchaeota archaeon]|nr:PD-(D/E)XK nuclease family protein [Candidatus Marsarchaeota archaeon]
MNSCTPTTYSMWNLFRSCRKACEWRYVRELVPIGRDGNLSFGSLMHECLERWHKDHDLTLALDHIDKAFVNRSLDDSQRAAWHLAQAMMNGYAACYPSEDFEVVALEKTFEGSIVNPATGAASRSFTLAGKIDCIVRMRATGEYYLLEHKTASQIDSDYLEKLWTDFQITLYCHYIEQTLGIRVAGVIYNVLAKAKLQQGKGETEAEFDARRADLIAKSKSGKSSATRRMPESDDAFAERLAVKYREPGMFHREVLYLSRDQFDVLRSDLWELTQQFLDCRRRGVFYRNTAFCFYYHRPCAYYPLCRSNGSENVIANFYEVRPPHEELRDETSEQDKETF